MDRNRFGWMRHVRDEQADVSRPRRKPEIVASLHKLGRSMFLESGYLMATAFTSLNVVWPSRAF